MSEHLNPPISPPITPSSGEHRLSDAHGTVVVPSGASFWRKLLAFSGPGFLVAVGYMDPGNWATDIGGGSAFGYTLLSVVFFSNLMAVLLQSLCAKLGIVTGRDLAQACRDHYSKPVVISLWLLCELAICACDLAEVIGTAIALKLLFHLPLIVGVILTALDVVAVLLLAHKGFRRLEAVVIALMGLITLCFGLEIFFSKPVFSDVFAGFIPTLELVRNPQMLYMGIAILGATVMPHNLYLHSSVVQTRKYAQNTSAKREALLFANLDSAIALTAALFVNAAILIVAAAAFHTRGRHDVAEIQDAYVLLSPTLGVAVAGVLFAVALLASGQNSTLTGTLAGQIVMEGFLHIRLRPWVRRLVTRGLAIIPAVICAAMYGDSGTTKLIVLSQVVLSLQLPFAVVPLVMFTNDRKKMGEFVNARWLRILAWVVAGLIIVLNVKLVYDFVVGN